MGLLRVPKHVRMALYSLQSIFLRCAGAEFHKGTCHNQSIDSVLQQRYFRIFSEFFMVQKIKVSLQWVRDFFVI